MVDRPRGRSASSASWAITGRTKLATVPVSTIVSRARVQNRIERMRGPHRARVGNASNGKEGRNPTSSTNVTLVSFCCLVCLIGAADSGAKGSAGAPLAEQPETVEDHDHGTALVPGHRDRQAQVAEEHQAHPH